MSAAALYPGRWSSPPQAPRGPAFPDGPILGNGDLGVSLGADLKLGELTLYLGLNQMWGIGSYSAPVAVDEVLPRRLALGGVSLSAPALHGGAFSATMDIAKGVVTATLRSPVAGLTLTALVVPDENTLVTTLRSNGTLASVGSGLPLNVTSWVQPLGRLCRSTPNRPGQRCLQMDGEVRAGAGAGLAWSLRQPLGSSSPKPVRAALATTLRGTPDQAFECAVRDDASSRCAARVAGELVLATAVQTNWDLCATEGGCADPLVPALARARGFNASRVAAAAAANAAFWDATWAAAWVRLPSDPVLERLYCAPCPALSTAPFSPPLPPHRSSPPARRPTERAPCAQMATHRRTRSARPAPRRAVRSASCRPWRYRRP